MTICFEHDCPIDSKGAEPLASKSLILRLHLAPKKQKKEKTPV
jgi:hypothetical protein